MATDVEQVKPGQVISSALFNSMMTRLADLEERVTDLENEPGGTVPGDPVAITGFSPPGEVHVGEDMAILGRGFKFPAMIAGIPPNPSVPANTVMLGDVQITSFLFDSTINRLSFTVPANMTIGAPTTVTVAVSNELGDADPRTYRLLPLVPPTVPAPTITGVTPLSRPDLPNVVIVGEEAVIEGTNFLTDPSKVEVTFTISIPGVGTVYRVPTSDITLATATQLRVRIPNVTQVLPFTEIVVILSVQVEGNSNVASRPVSARR
jgi:hypothetical protein